MVKTECLSGLLIKEMLPIDDLFPEAELPVFQIKFQENRGIL